MGNSNYTAYGNMYQVPFHNVPYRFHAMNSKVRCLYDEAKYNTECIKTKVVAILLPHVIG